MLTYFPRRHTHFPRTYFPRRYTRMLFPRKYTRMLLPQSMREALNVNMTFRSYMRAISAICIHAPNAKMLDALLRRLCLHRLSLRQVIYPPSLCVCLRQVSLLQLKARPRYSKRTACKQRASSGATFQTLRLPFPSRLYL